MGRPKALLRWRGKHLINAHIHALQVHCRQVIIVTGKHDDEIRSVIEDAVLTIHNDRWETTEMADSLRLALHECHGTALVTPVDCVPVPARVIQALSANGAPAVPQYRGIDGHPILIHVNAFRSFEGHLQMLLRTAKRVQVDWRGAVETWNTPDEWATYSASDESTRN